MSALILGVGPGLGLALARAYGGAGHKVAVVARRPEAVSNYVSSLVGVDAVGLTADLADPVSVTRVVREAAGDLGPLDVVHYNASVLLEGTPSKVGLAEVEQSWRVGCLGAWAALQAAVPLMPQGAAFLVTNSGLAQKPWPPASALSAAKAALHNMVQAAAAELTDIRVAMLTVMGMIRKGTDLDPDEIARAFVDLLEQTDPPVESFIPRR
ncbi:MAG TPA: SDR family oxidoreductase [Actinomycetota bacterium]|nr:SDR family oxidoreductase [Actinomycetota bacterium]